MTDVVRDTNPDLDAERIESLLQLAATDALSNEEFNELVDAVPLLIAALRSERAGREKAETALRIAAGALEIASQHATGHDVVLASEVELRGVASSALEIVRAVLAGEGDTDE